MFQKRVVFKKNCSILPLGLAGMLVMFVFFHLRRAPGTAAYFWNCFQAHVALPLTLPRCQSPHYNVQDFLNFQISQYGMTFITRWQIVKLPAVWCGGCVSDQLKKAAFLASPVISVCHPLTLKCNVLQTELTTLHFSCTGHRCVKPQAVNACAHPKLSEFGFLVFSWTSKWCWLEWTGTQKKASGAISSIWTICGRWEGDQSTSL